MKPLCVSACLLGGLLLTGLAAGCASAGTQPPESGHLKGRLVMEGGPLGPGGKQPGERAMSGTVTFTTAGHQPITVKVGSSGTFSIPLPPGRYQASGRSPEVMEIDGGRSRELPCSQPTLAVVTAGQTATITLTCVVP
ncbi:MAG: hypothetical protein ACRDPF_20670 [Streptosporangiaceae bacterium]